VADDEKTAVDPLIALRSAILDAALPDVVFDGWSEALLRRAASRADVDPAMVTLAFPRGALDLAVAFHRRGDADMLAQLDGPDFEAMGMTAKITHAVRTRLEIAGPHEEAVRRATAMFALPPYAAEGARMTWETADAIWNAAGDTAGDYNWYTKRLTLSGVFSSTLLYWLGDPSEDKEATWRFLDRRIGDVMRFEKFKGSMRKNPLARALMAGPNAVLSKVRAPQKGRGPDGLDVGLPGSEA
jgi:ubiquinone biosynthesis protein COQ9